MALAAVAATFWLVVATIRLVIRDDAAVRPAETSGPPPVEVSTRLPAGEPPATPTLPARHAGECTCEAGDDCSGDRGDYKPRHSRDDDADVFSGPGGGPMAKAALVKGLNDVRPRVSACYAKYRVPGTAMVDVVIAKSGAVTSADVTGKFAGTPTGACVERAVKKARFPRSDGFRTPYPYQLK